MALVVAPVFDRAERADPELEEERNLFNRRMFQLAIECQAQALNSARHQNYPGMFFDTLLDDRLNQAGAEITETGDQLTAWDNGLPGATGYMPNERHYNQIVRIHMGAQRRYQFWLDILDDNVAATQYIRDMGLFFRTNPHGTYIAPP